MKKLIPLVAVMALAVFAAPQAKAGVHVSIGGPGVYVGPAYDYGPYYGYYGPYYGGGYYGYYGHPYYHHYYHHWHR